MKNQIIKKQKMRLIILILSILIIGTKSNAQTFENNFLGEDFLLYKGTFLKLKDDAYSGYKYTFYEDLKYCQSTIDENVIYPTRKNNSYTVSDSLANRVFLVENIIDINGRTWDTNTDIYLDKPVLVLIDTLTKQIIYYKYDKKYEFNFPFNTSKIKYDEKAFFSEINREVDDFTGVVKISSPLLSGLKLSQMIIYKYINRGKSHYILGLSTYGNIVTINGTGVIVLFSDGTKWTRQSKIDVDAENDGFEYSAYITLTEEDLIRFSTKKIKKFRLYIYDAEINSNDANKFKLFVKCVRKAK